MIGKSVTDRLVLSRSDKREDSNEKARILVADAFERIRRSLAYILGESGYEVEMAGSGPEVLEKAEEQSFNLAIVDIRLPETTGLELIHSLHDLHPDMAVMVLTDYPSLEIAKNALNNGALAFITKPWDVEEMQFTIREALEKQRLLVENRRLRKDIQKELEWRKQTQDRLNILASVARYSPVAVMIFDSEGIIRFINPKFMELTEYDPENVIGSHVTELGENTAEQNREIWEAISAGGEWTGKIHNRKRSGESYWVASHISPVKDSRGEITHYIEVHEDITERIAAKEEIRAERERAQRYMDIAGVAFLALDRLGRITLTNRKCLDLLGYDEEDLIGRSWFDTCVPDRDREELLDRFERLMEGEAELVERYESRIVTSEKKERTIAWHTTLLRDESGEISGTLSSGEDISEQKQAEEELRRRNRELTLLNQVIVAATSSLGPLTVLETTCREMALAFDVPQAMAALLDRKSENLRVVAEYRSPELPSSLRLEIPLDNNPAAQYVREFMVPLAVAEAQTDPRMAPIHDLMRKQGVVSILILPLIVNERVVGIIALDPRGHRKFTYDEIALGNNAAKAASQVLESARLLEDARIRASRQEALNKIIAESVNAEDLKHLMIRALKLTMQAMEIGCGTICVAGLYHVEGLPQQIGEEMSLLIESSRIVASGLHTTLVVRDFMQSKPAEKWADFSALMGSYGIRACIMVPITSEDRLLGALALTETGPRSWSTEEISLAEAIGQQLGEAAARLYLLQQTEEQAERIQHIMNTVSEGLLLLDADRKVLLANPLAEKYLSLLTDDDLKEPLERLGNKSIHELLGNPIRGAVHTELTVREPRQRIFEVTSNSTGTGPLAGGWALALRDVTESRWQQQYQQQKERLATVGQLAAGIAHDFNNIMAVIVLYSDILLRSTELSQKAQERLTVINEQAQHAASLTDQILSFSSSLRVERKPVDLLTFLKGLTKLLERTLPESIDIKLNYDDSDHIVNADITRLQQALMNLALNARDAMKDGGTLGLDLRGVTLEVGAKPFMPDMPPGDWVRLVISDTGSGIETENLTHIFEPFYTTKSPGEGSGLGLAQVYGIVNQHEGFIDVASRTGRGTTFSIYLPAAVLPKTGPLGPIETAPLVGGIETILLVEDNEATGKAVRAALEGEGYLVLMAKNGQEALSVFEEHEHEISLVVTDLVMPGMGGEALNKILQERNPGLKVIVITGYLFDGGGEALIEQGVSAWLQKPFSMKKIAKLVRKVLDN